MKSPPPPHILYFFGLSRPHLSISFLVRIKSNICPPLYNFYASVPWWHILWWVYLCRQDSYLFPYAILQASYNEEGEYTCTGRTPTGFNLPSCWHHTTEEVSIFVQAGLLPVSICHLAGIIQRRRWVYLCRQDSYLFPYAILQASYIEGGEYICAGRTPTCFNLPSCRHHTTEKVSIFVQAGLLPVSICHLAGIIQRRRYLKLFWDCTFIQEGRNIKT